MAAKRFALVEVVFGIRMVQPLVENSGASSGAWACSLKTCFPGTPHRLEGGRTGGLGMPSSIDFYLHPRVDC